MSTSQPIKQSNDNNRSVRCQTVEGLDNQSALEYIARNDTDVDVRIQAILKLTDRSVLEDIIKHNDIPAVYDAAAANLAGSSIPYRKKLEREAQSQQGLDCPKTNQALEDCRNEIHDWQYDMFVPSGSGLRSRRRCMTCGRAEVCEG